MTRTRRYAQLAILLGCLFSPNIWASAMPAFSLADNISHTLAIKKSGQDSATRTGTENWEQPQGDFFIVPALVLGVVGLFLFFHKD